eukprot:TRINITY_DN674_c0_g1_i1.p1 TRINITY_DN674_c0_g1~~TRINITY_DN674_c0_g1_i1.p1  ORF type:complete len:299 (+),score=112.95 TRINITY_DN674_c0_g1_i1:37-897(+)
MYGKVLLGVLCSVTAVHGWWCEGHMLVAEIASLHLSHSANQRLEEYASYLHKNGPFPKSADWKQLACWPDDIKSAISMTSAWHYINIPINPDNLPDVPQPPADNIVSALNSESRTLGRLSQYNIYENSFTLGMYIHFVADAHMPLHCVGYFSNTFPPPKGDLGGNMFYIVVNNTETKLHSFWDSVGGMYENLPRPLDNANKHVLKNIAEGLVEKYGGDFTQLQIENDNYYSWAEEGHEVAVDHVYAGITNGTVVSQQYIETTRDIGQRQITLAGLRLAHLLKGFFQ